MTTITSGTRAIILAHGISLQVQAPSLQARAITSHTRAIFQRLGYHFRHMNHLFQNKGYHLWLSSWHMHGISLPTQAQTLQARAITSHTRAIAWDITFGRNTITYGQCSIFSGTKNITFSSRPILWNMGYQVSSLQAHVLSFPTQGHTSHAILLLVEGLSHPAHELPLSARGLSFPALGLSWHMGYHFMYNRQYFRTKAITSRTRAIILAHGILLQVQAPFRLTSGNTGSQPYNMSCNLISISVHIPCNYFP